MSRACCLASPVVAAARNRTSMHGDRSLLDAPAVRADHGRLPILAWCVSSCAQRVGHHRLRGVKGLAHQARSRSVRMLAIESTLSLHRARCAQACLATQTWWPQVCLHADQSLTLRTRSSVTSTCRDCYIASERALRFAAHLVCCTYLRLALHCDCQAAAFDDLTNAAASHALNDRGRAQLRALQASELLCEDSRALARCHSKMSPLFEFKACDKQAAGTDFATVALALYAAVTGWARGALAR